MAERTPEEIAAGLGRGAASVLLRATDDGRHPYWRGRVYGHHMSVRALISRGLAARGALPDRPFDEDLTPTPLGRQVAAVLRGEADDA